MGGVLGAKGDYYMGARIAVAGSLLSVLLTVLFMPSDTTDGTTDDTTGDTTDTHTPELKDTTSTSTTATTTTTTTPEDTDQGKAMSTRSHDVHITNTTTTDGSTSTTTIPTTMAVIRLVWLFLFAKVVTSVANAIAAAALPLILKNTYGLDEKALGFSMSAMSFCNAIVNGLFLAPIIGLAGGDLTKVSLRVGDCGYAILCYIAILY
jgi:hypothetical protein